MPDSCDSYEGLAMTECRYDYDTHIGKDRQKTLGVPFSSF